MPPTTQNSLRVIRAACGFLVCASAVLARGEKIELPAESATFKQAADADFVTAQCVACHSADYVAIQPPMARIFWQNVVTKMQQKFGAPIAPADAEKIVEYLTKNYGAPSPPAAK